jgi:SAM-dependent methyltransferase
MTQAQDSGSRDMNGSHPVDLFFGGMDKLGPGSNGDTLKVLDMLPELSFRVIVDAGCGSGRQTLALASRLQTPVHAVDSHAPFLASLVQRAREAGVKHLIRTYCMNMQDIPNSFAEIDLLWSEGAAWNIGFPRALGIWHSAVKANGFAVVSERSWLRNNIPAEVRRYFERAYPEMRTVERNRSQIKAAGYAVLGTYTLPREAWMDGYYDVLRARATALLDHPDELIREFAAAVSEKIRIFDCSEESYGYVFYVMRKD